MSQLSRRNVMTTAVALPVLAVPALASFSPDHPDAELLRLGAQLEEIGREVEALNELAHRRGNEWRAACERAGLPDVAWYDWPGGEAKMDEWREYENKRMALFPGHGKEEDNKMDRLLEKLYPLVDEIMVAQAKTLDGLRVQARALAVNVPEFWDNHDDVPTELDFIGAVFTFLGLGDNGKPLTA